MNPKIKKIREFWKDFSSNKVAVVSLIIFMLILMLNFNDICSYISHGIAEMINVNVAFSSALLHY